MSLEQQWITQTALHTATAAISLSGLMPEETSVNLGGKTHIQTPSPYLLAKGLGLAAEAIRLASILDGMKDDDFIGVRQSLTALEAVFNTDTNRLCLLSPVDKLLQRVYGLAQKPYTQKALELPKFSCSKGPKPVFSITPYAMTLGAIVLTGSDDIRPVLPSTGIQRFYHDTVLDLLSPTHHTTQKLVEHWISRDLLANIIGCLQLIEDSIEAIPQALQDRVLGFTEKYREILEKLQEAPLPDLTSREAWEPVAIAQVRVSLSDAIPVTITPLSKRSFRLSLNTDTPPEDLPTIRWSLTDDGYHLVRFSPLVADAEETSGSLFDCFATKFTP